MILASNCKGKMSFSFIICLWHQFLLPQWTLWTATMWLMEPLKYLFWLLGTCTGSAGPSSPPISSSCQLIHLNSVQHPDQEMTKCYHEHNSGHNKSSKLNTWYHKNKWCHISEESLIGERKICTESHISGPQRTQDNK